MKFFPVVERELRTASRRTGTYWIRFGAAGVAIGVTAWILLLTHESSRTEELSRAIFASLSVLAFIYCLFAGVRNTADCISEEKREGTLGLLFLTDLKPFEVLFGKLAATSLNSFYGLVAMFPVLALPLLLGGTTFEQYGAMLLILLDTLFLSLAVGICVSVFVQGERAAMMLTIAVLAYICAGWSLTGWIFVDRIFGFKGAFDGPESEMVFGWNSPIYTMSKLLGSMDKAQIDSAVWPSLGVIHLLGWVFIVIAQRKLPHVWKDKADTITSLRWRQRWKLWTHGTSEQRLQYRERLLDDSPTLWLGSRHRLKPAIVWMVFGLIGVGWVWGLVVYPHEWLDEGNYVITGLLLTLILKVWVAIEASHRFNHDRHSGALELLLSTPLDVAEIVRGQLQALKRQFLWPAVSVLAVLFLFVLSEKAKGGLVSWWLGSMAMLVADLVSIAYIGMWLGLKGRYATRASGATLARILVLPWVLLIAFFTFVAITSRFGGMSRTEDLFLIVWLMLGLGVDIFFGLKARNGLHGQLRDLAASRFDSGTPKNG